MIKLINKVIILTAIVCCGNSYSNESNEKLTMLNDIISSNYDYDDIYKQWYSINNNTNTLYSTEIETKKIKDIKTEGNTEVETNKTEVKEDTNTEYNTEETEKLVNKNSQANAHYNNKNTKNKIVIESEIIDTNSQDSKYINKNNEHNMKKGINNISESKDIKYDMIKLGQSKNEQNKQQFNIWDIIPKWKKKEHEAKKKEFDQESITIHNNITLNIQPTYSRPIRILSLYGGGTRGYAQNAFLEQFCLEAGIDNIGEYFDLIAGSSIGGMNGVALASGIAPSYMMQTFYRKQAPWIFTTRSTKDVLMFSNNASIPSNKPNTAKMLYMLSISDPFYKAKSQTSNYGDATLRSACSSVFGDKSLTTINTPVLLTAHNLSDGNPVIFTNRSDLKLIPQTYSDVKIVDAMMATSSFPVYYDSVTMNLSGEQQKIVDGGLFQCNPSTLAFMAAQKLYPSADKYCILSIGTGLKNIKMDFSSSKNIIYNLLPVKYTKLLDINIGNAEFTSDALLQNLSSKENSKISYYNFNFELDRSRDCGLDTSTPDFFDYLDTAVNARYQEDHENIKQFMNTMNGVENEQINSNDGIN